MYYCGHCLTLSCPLAEDVLSNFNVLCLKNLLVPYLEFLHQYSCISWETIPFKVT
jgi:hypothetical protein